MWIRKADKSTFDNWRYDLAQIFDGNCLIAHPSYIDQARHPVLHGLVVSYEKFLREYYLCNDYYKTSYILNNPIIYRGRGSNMILNKTFFNQNPEVNFSNL